VKILEPFLEASLREGFLGAAAPADAWAAKSGLSVFDEEQVLAAPEASREGPEPAQIEITMVAQELVLSRIVDFTEPSYLRAVRESCCMYTLTVDSADSCPICLDMLRAGEVAWRLPCWHQVHNSCALRFFRMRNVKPLCPLCRCDARSNHSGASTLAAALQEKREDGEEAEHSEAASSST